MTDLQAQAIERRLERIESLLSRLLDLPTHYVIPQGIDNDTARLVALARQDRGAAIAETKRIAKKFMRNGGSKKP